MPKIIDLVRARAAGDESKDGEPKPFIAFEYYPPRTEEGVANLYKRLGRMAKLSASSHPFRGTMRITAAHCRTCAAVPQTRCTWTLRGALVAPRRI